MSSSFSSLFLKTLIHGVCCLVILEGALLERKTSRLELTSSEGGPEMTNKYGRAGGVEGVVA